MKKIFPLLLLAILSLALTSIPGCDKLVTKENYNYDTVTIIINDSNCVACHSDNINNPTLKAKRSWTYSGHSSDTLTDFEFHGFNTKDCGPQCHTSQGFLRSLTGAAVEPATIYSEIGCFTCHKPHTTWDYRLRDSASVTLASGYFYNRLQSNICARCHRSIANPATVVVAPASVTETWGPHASTAADMLTGHGGFQYPDSVYSSSAHSTYATNGCINCHQDSTKGRALGGHSERLSDGSELLVATCNRDGCHVSNPMVGFTGYDSLQIVYAQLIDSLKVRLIAANLLGIDDLPVARTVESIDSAGALFNYLFVLNDRSHGVHNTSYAVTLLKQSIIDLDI
jgi:cytochrome c551/c552